MVLCLCFPGRVCSVVYRHGSVISMVDLNYLRPALRQHEPLSGHTGGCGALGVQLVLAQMRFGELRGGILAGRITH